jgi:ribosomal protein L11 methyltransferase
VLYLSGSVGGFETERDGAALFIAVFSSGDRAREARDLLHARGIAAAPERTIEQKDWNAAYRARLTPFSVAGFLIDARDEPDAPSGAAERFLHIPAAGAFGTGLHESTRGILRFLEKDDLAGKRVLDVGCGTGILAIAAARLGAAWCAAFDMDSEAVFEARKNLARNPVGGRVVLFLGGIECLIGKFDRVLANMIWEEVEPLLPSIAKLLVPGGLAVLSGILDERERNAVAGLRVAGLAVRGIDADGEWRVVVAEE